MNSDFACFSMNLEYGSQDMVTFYVEMFSEQKQELTTQGNKGDIVDKVG